jgi:uracil-DNA glycosylase
MVCRLRCKAKVVAFLPVQIDLNSLLPEQWQNLIDTSVLDQISQKLAGEFLPTRSDIFKAFECDPDLIKIIILGQDPYPNPEHAMGLAFSVPETKNTLPASLKNIFLELKSDLGVDRKSGDLSDWAAQGVFLLNTCLTVLPNDPLAHTKIGWQQFTESIIAHLSKREVIGILWGNHAQKMNHYFAQADLFTSVHPSPLSAYRGFFGSKPFSKSNKRLVEKGLTPIKW